MVYCPAIVLVRGELRTYENSGWEVSIIFVVCKCIKCMDNLFSLESDGLDVVYCLYQHNGIVHYSLSELEREVKAA